jgi:hypothetical protein
MDIFTINNDIKVFCVTADSFPEGIGPAHQKLQSILPQASGRKFFGISLPSENGVIIYKAAVEEQYEGEAEKYGLETFIIKKGRYICETLNNWHKDVPFIGKTFQQLLKDPRIDKNGYCLEIYLNDSDMMCLVGIDSDINNKNS